MGTSFSIQSIGVIHSPFKTLEQMPIQPTGEQAAEGSVELFPEYKEGLKDLDGFSHVILIYLFHKANTVKLSVTPFLDDQERGVFATRAPVRPNHVGISVVEVDRIEDTVIYLKKVDVLDGTPLLDVKPLVPDFDIPKTKVSTGWMETVSGHVSRKLSDDRFI